jgi:H+-transporting ATPase
MGLLSFAESLGLLLIGLEWLGNQSLMSIASLESDSLKTMMFLQLAVGGHLLLFVVRSRDSVFVPPYPSSSLLLAIVATQIVAILICSFGILMPKLPWAAVLGVWIYCLAWMVVIDLVKLLYVRREAEQDGHLQVLAKPIAN